MPAQKKVIVATVKAMEIKNNHHVSGQCYCTSCEKNFDIQEAKSGWLISWANGDHEFRGRCPFCGYDNRPEGSVSWRNDTPLYQWSNEHLDFISAKIPIDEIIAKALELIEKIKESCHSIEVVKLANELKELIEDIG